jgi:WhiB family redox-sensing transcriptional regulator
VHQLRAAGLSVKQIAAEANVTRMTIARLIGVGCGNCRKTRRLHHEIASRILAVRSPLPVVDDGEYRWTLADDTIGVLPQGFVGSARRSLAWQRRGNCADPDVPTWLFFPSRGDRKTLEAALAVCAGCAVRAECLSYGLQTGSAGIWGGTTEIERQRLKGLRARPVPR